MTGFPAIVSMESISIIPQNPKTYVKGAFCMGINIDKLVKSQKTPVFVIPAKADIQETQPLMDSRSPIRSRTSFAGMTALVTFYETINIQFSILNIQSTWG